MAGDLQPQADELLQLREENEKLRSLVELETFSLVESPPSQLPPVGSPGATGCMVGTGFLTLGEPC